MKPLKQKVSITLDEDVVEKLKVLAEDCEELFRVFLPSFFFS